MRFAPALLAVTLPACIVVPQTDRTTTVVAVEHEHVTPRTALHLDVVRADGQIELRVVAPRTCGDRTVEVVDITEVDSATLDTSMAALDWPFVLVAIVIAPLTISISAAITYAVNDRGERTHRERHPRDLRPYACPVFGEHLAVTLTWPSGATSSLVTDASGTATIEIPALEPELGDVTVRVGELPPRVVTYFRDCRKTRSERMRRAQQAANVEERTRQLLALPTCPGATG